ncbi:MAG: glycosyltransferase family 4 protein [Gammaproteobacteria bacterium]|nr:glycosyltransferase family 4 protein [Gammaproteobacteria bacterium]
MLARGFGGAERSFVDIVAALVRRGHQVQAICHPRFRAREALHAAAQIDCVTTLGAWDPLARRRLARAMASFRPQVVHTHLARAAHLAGSAARSLGLPTLAKTHNYVDLRYYRAIDRLVATTADQARYLCDAGTDAARVTVIPNFSPLETARPHPPAPGQPVRLLAYGRMVAKKGFEVLLEALATLTPAPAWRLTLGGDGPARARIAARIARLGLQPRVRLCGWIPDVRAALLEHDVFVLPSIDEPFGIAVLEAMACGVPIVTTSTRGPGEILDAQTALFAVPGETASLARALHTALAEPAAGQTRAAAALERFTREYSEQAVLPRYEALYRALAG